MNDKLRYAMHQYLGAGWTIVSQTDTAIQLSKKDVPGLLTALFLLLWGIVPGLLYIFWPRPRKLVHLSLSEGKVWRVGK